VAEFDVIVLGGGPGGYIAAERLARAGRSVLLAEKTAVGGTCLNVGCIPTKALMGCAKLYDEARGSARFGVNAADVSYDWSVMQDWKARAVASLVGGVTGMLKRAGVVVQTGEAGWRGGNRVVLGGEVHRGRDIIIATGSSPVWPDIAGVAGNPLVVDSTGLLEVAAVPARLAVVGGGVIGIEFASIFARLGTAVTVIEALDEVLGVMDRSLAARLRTSAPGVDFHLGTVVEAIDGGRVTCSKGGATFGVEADLVLMAVGRRPNVTGWLAEGTGLDFDARGVRVDDRMATNVDHVWAVGDVTGRGALAHAAYRMGEVAAANILARATGGAAQVFRAETVPWAVYGYPEAAGVGLTEEACRSRGLAVASVTLPLGVSGRFVAEHGASRAGLVKLVAETASGVVRGVQLVGPYAPEIIWGAAHLLETGSTIADIRSLVFPHPSISEAIREAAWAFPTEERNPR